MVLRLRALLGIDDYGDASLADVQDGEEAEAIVPLWRRLLSAAVIPAILATVYFSFAPVRRVVNTTVTAARAAIRLEIDRANHRSAPEQPDSPFPMESPEETLDMRRT